MELRQAEYFLAVIEHGTITRAAAVLRVAQPSLSQSIRTLEKQLATQLFDRVGRRLTPSEAGLALVPQARRLLTEAATARAAVNDVLTMTRGTLTIAVHAELIVDPLAPLVGEFRRRYPGVLVELIDPNSNNAAIRMLQNGECDAAVTTIEDPGPALSSFNLGTQTLSLVAAPSFPLPEGDPLPLKYLADVPLILTPPTTSGRALIESVFAKAGTPVNAMVECAPREAIWTLTMAGAGASFFLPAMAAAAGPLGAQVRSTDPSISRPVLLLSRKGPNSTAFECFLTLVKESIVMRTR
ncbi:hypothetical protein B2J88_36405 [Rhodococcus sp. SRB_17]|uniref:LysR family transcriptional regulator n=1 Tax=Rhodococcus sp. OK302 TaxID=1882769 RepID=UPI000B93CB93|nr:LysR substrate-binding domain-containing protein [Rhodococcus sp. OK302]NMM89759.1 hypothetical protein [Rhodococcus sp. SRB_17]OYD66853.1 LysR family transcriptional regulator [Rhodococcus sp. OK302]